MREDMQELIKKCEQDYGITVDARDMETYWVITARIPKNQEARVQVDHVRKYIATRNDRGSVLIVPNAQVSDRYFVETWGEMETLENFVKMALARIPADGNSAPTGEAEGCGTPLPRNNTKSLPGIMDQLPPSSKIVLRILGTEGAMTHKEIVKKSHCPPRTVRYALRKLKERKLLIEKMNLRDMRQIIYQFRVIPLPESGIGIPPIR